MEFSCKIPFELTIAPYRLRTIQNSDELNAVLELRKLCFNADIDKMQFDLAADHLIVEDIEKKILCGTYRLTHSDFSTHFECEEDFEIPAFLEKNEAKLELAWACIHPEYRNGTIVSLLWRGITEVIKIRSAKYIFGTTSIKGEPEDIARIQDALQGKELPFPVLPRRSHVRKILPLDADTGLSTSSASWRRLLPGLLRAYLMAGALVCAQPSYDIDLNCYDFMTVIDVDQATDSLIHHYNL
ncbi:MAG: GNAT family N-acetyltransferase [Bdellovibrionales bacterium]|nr:GNAT family N-acetyltransferase [Bdellovibrionales bacterium]